MNGEVKRVRRLQMKQMRSGQKHNNSGSTNDHNNDNIDDDDDDNNNNNNIFSSISINSPEGDHYNDD